MFGWKGPLTREHTEKIAETKQVIYDGFKTAIELGVPREKAGILVDEQFGAAILRDAAADKFFTSCPCEKSGQEEFDFEYGEEFAKHIETFRPTFCKVLVRYNAEGDKALNKRQSARLNGCQISSTGKARACICSNCWCHPRGAAQACRRQEGL